MDTARPGGVRRILGLAPVVSLGVIVLLAVTFSLLNINADTGSAESDRFVASLEWTAWRLIAATAVVAFVIVLIAGIRVVHDRADWGVDAPRAWAIGYVAIAAVLALAVIATVVITGGANPILPVRDLNLRTRTVLCAGLASAVPWLALAWLCRDSCRPPDRRPWGSGQPLTYQQLTDLWRLMVACVGAFAIAVVGALLTAGGLRNAFLGAHPPCGDAFTPLDQRPEGKVCGEDFPAVAVLLYGAVFALLLLAIALPLVAAWRQRALEWVNARSEISADGVPAAESIEQAQVLREQLHLNTSLLRNPLTLFSIFTPLVTSTIAAFLPQLG